MAIDAVTGLIRWTPDENQCPAVFDVIVKASIIGSPELEDKRLLRINVLKHAFAPGLKPIPSIHIPVGKAYRYTVKPIVLGPSLQYLLGATVSSAKLDAKTGEFAWIPSKQDIGTNCLFLISAFDPATGRVSSVTSFTLTVDPAPIEMSSSSGTAPHRILNRKKSKRSNSKAGNHRNDNAEKPAPTTAQYRRIVRYGVE